MNDLSLGLDYVRGLREGLLMPVGSKKGEGETLDRSPTNGQS